MKHGLITKNVGYEIGFHTICDGDSLFDITLRASYKGDHRGVFFLASIAKFLFECNIYDIRHEDQYDK
jgi:hypothetical protein